MYAWYQILGLLFIPIGVYFAVLASPAFSPSAKFDSHAAQVGIVVMIYAFLVSALIICPVYFVVCAHPYVRLAFVGYV